MAAQSTWVCPNCRRRVPRYAQVCHCGTRKQDLDLLAAPGAKRRRDRWAPLRGLNRGVWLWFGAMVVVLAAMVVRMLMPWQPPRYFPLLGQVDRMPTPQAHHRVQR